MGLVILMIFIGLPVAEIWLIMKVASILGFWDTLFLLIFSAFFGVYLARMQGALALQKVQQCLAEGRMPATEMFDGILLFLGGILFVIPGFITDGIGLLLIFPPTRWCIKWLLARNTSFRFTAGQSAGRPSGFPAGDVPLPQTKPAARDSRVPRGNVQDAEIVE